MPSACLDFNRRCVAAIAIGVAVKIMYWLALVLAFAGGLTPSHAAAVDVGGVRVLCTGSSNAPPIFLTYDTDNVLERLEVVQDEKGQTAGAYVRVPV